MNNISIRNATRGDCTRMLELVKELAVYERAPGEVTVTPEHFEETGFGTNPLWWAIVAEAGEDIVGFALYYIRYSTWKGARMYLEDIIVTEQWRGKGIGTLLFNRLIEVAREKRFNAISWQVLEWNAPAINFYKKYNTAFDGEWVNCSINVSGEESSA